MQPGAAQALRSRDTPHDLPSKYREVRSRQISEYRRGRPIPLWSAIARVLCNGVMVISTHLGTSDLDYGMDKGIPLCIPD